MSATWLGFRSLLSHDTGKTRERDMRVTYLPRAALLSFAVLAVAATPAAAKTISVSAGTPDANEKLQETLILAAPADVVELGAATWTLPHGLSRAVDHSPVRGPGTT